jgi:large subunit ribosomal protein L17
MRHRKAGSKFNRNSSHRKAMFKNMVTSLLKYDRIRTTDAKAKELRGLADHLITLAKRGDLHARRQALAIVREKDVVHKLFEEAPKRFNDLAGGYTRVVKVDRRPGDATMMSIIELVTPETKTKKKKKTPKKKSEVKPVQPETKAAKTAETTPAEAADSGETVETETAPDTPPEDAAESKAVDPDATEEK